MGATKRYRCKKGHVLRGRNIYLRKKGQRECKLCSIERVRAWRRIQAERKPKQ